MLKLIERSTTMIMIIIIIIKNKFDGNNNDDEFFRCIQSAPYRFLVIMVQIDHAFIREVGAELTNYRVSK